jgi:hypothetical protein
MLVIERRSGPISLLGALLAVTAAVAVIAVMTVGLVLVGVGACAAGLIRILSGSRRNDAPAQDATQQSDGLPVVELVRDESHAFRAIESGPRRHVRSVRL